MAKNMRRVVLMVGLILAPAAAFAGSSSTDWTLGAGGLYSWTGGNSSLTGSNIPVFGVLGDSTPKNNSSSLSIVDGLLNFTSGAFGGTSTTWSWTGGGILNLTGCIAGVTATTCTGSNDVTLISDDFTSVQTVPQLSFGTLSFDAVFGNVTGTINSSVAAYFGVPTAFSIGSFSSAIATVGSVGSPLTGTNIGGVLKADPTTAVPEYRGIGETLGLLAFAIIAFGGLIRLGALRSPVLRTPIRS